MLETFLLPLQGHYAHKVGVKNLGIPKEAISPFRPISLGVHSLLLLQYVAVTSWRANVLQESGKRAWAYGESCVRPQSSQDLVFELASAQEMKKLTTRQVRLSHIDSN
eukprot:5976014-Amphidinium_carterae.1